mmetsp:Transcript_24356/g.36298  ORF Transcript_24356/g.36298 Transcript_24356/m.36298 type:complete len:546 (+) Transcript_24356:52-1689(+)
MSPDSGSKCCPICMEDYSSSLYAFFFSSLRPKTVTKGKELPCCSQKLCHQCLYSHIKSILEEGITLQGRTSLSCPFLNCDCTLSDSCVRQSFTENGSLWTTTNTSTTTGARNNESGSDGDDRSRDFCIALLAVIRPVKYFIGRLLYFIISNMLFNIFLLSIQIIRFVLSICRGVCASDTDRENSKRSSTAANETRDRLILWKYNLKISLLKSEQERKDLELYERWSLTIALNCHSHGGVNTLGNVNDEDNEGDDDDDDDSYSKGGENKERQANDDGDANHLYTHVTRCPAPNCPCLWLTNRVYYNEKIKNERKYGGSTTSNKHHNKGQKSKSTSFFPTSIIKSATSYLFYKPIHPRREEEILTTNGYTTEHWVNPVDINLFPTKNIFGNGRNRNYNTMETISNRRAMLNRSANQNVDKDGRISTCPLCKHTFCNLCLRPWHTLHATSGKFLFHTNMQCSKYNKKSVSESDRIEFMNMADAADARLCPGCSMRTNRTEGCNHMTCPCGYHWCYVCECKWNSRHYACTDSNPLIVQNPNADAGCIIS